MTTVLDQLHTDHINVAKLLELFEKELEEFSDSDSEPDYLKWQNILLYMTTYQDIFHHPTEEKLFEHIGCDEKTISQAIEEVESQHEVLHQKSKKIHQLLGDVETSFITVERSELINTCEDFIKQLQKHMSLEESIIFPFAKEKMVGKDWSVFEKEIDQIDDPLFGAKQRAEFADLYQCICAQ